MIKDGGIAASNGYTPLHICYTNHWWISLRSEQKKEELL
jgi:hypothetical protein